MKKLLLLCVFLFAILVSGCSTTLDVQRSQPYNYTIYYTPDGIRFYTDGSFYYDYYGNRLHWNSYQIYNYMEYNRHLKNNSHRDRIDSPKRDRDDRKPDIVKPREDEKRRDNSGERNRGSERDRNRK